MFSAGCINQINTKLDIQYIPLPCDQKLSGFVCEDDSCSPYTTKMEKGYSPKEYSIFFWDTVYSEHVCIKHAHMKLKK